MSGESAAAVLLWASACLLQSSRTPDWKQQVLICPTGFDFGSCPGWSACQHHPVYSLWRHASQNVSLRLFFALQSETWLWVDHPPSVCRNGLWERHRAAERVRGRGLQQEEVSRAEPPTLLGGDSPGSAPPQHVWKRGAGQSGPLQGELRQHPGGERSGGSLHVRKQSSADSHLWLTWDGEQPHLGTAAG